MRICFIASEVAPLAKTGGLADVASALPRYLHEAGHDVRLFMPLYSSIDIAKLGGTAVENVQDVPVDLGSHHYRFSVVRATLPSTNVPIHLIQCPELFHRGTLYGEADDHLRFLLLQRAALDTCQRMQFAPQIVHCNDWHTALVPMLLKSAYAWDRLFNESKTITTIHNIGYQGQFSASTLPDIGTEVRNLVNPLDLSRGHINWLREGIRLSDAVTTVSPTYAREIRTPYGGSGLDDSIRERGESVVGILNGVDYEEWNPATDRYLQHHFDSTNLEGKRANKALLLDRFNLPTADLNHPLIGIVSRLTVQKGFDLLFDTLPEILTSRDFKLIVLGNGDARYENFFAELQQRFADRVVFYRGFSVEISHLIEASADIFLMPSLYEPCGLNQMYSLKYGTVPIVRRTGGLADSVQHWDAATRTGTGVVFNDFDANAIRWALHTALDLYKDPDQWVQIVRNGMEQNFSWEVQGAEYVALYKKISGLT